MKTTTPAPAADTAATPGEPRNVAVTVLDNRTLIGKAICAAGRLDFPLTMTDAKQLEALGKVRIEGIFTTEQPAPAATFPGTASLQPQPAGESA